MRKLGLVVLASCLPLLVVPTASANNSAGYHWRGTGSRVVTVVDSVNGTWDAALRTAAAGWSASAVINMPVALGDDSRKTRKKCPVIEGQIRVCSFNYGRTSWAGITRVWYTLSGRHVVRGFVKLNDRRAKSDNLRLAITCHELGHVVGLSHRPQRQDSSCMTPRVGPSQVAPDAHDRSKLLEIYDHSDGSSAPADGPTGSRQMRVERDGPYMVVTTILEPTGL
jgi:hypothetical protein